MNDRKVDPIKTINKLISEKQALSDELEAAKAEIERLKKELNADVYTLQIERSNGKTQKVQKVLLLRANAIKAEAIKEFAERLKNKLFNTEYALDRYYRRDIDKLVKEMEGENNA